MASGFRLSAPAEYRRGVVLGLTLAEVLVLIVFLLLLTMTAFLMRKEHEQAVVRGERDRYGAIARVVQQAAAAQGVAIEDLRLANLLAEGAQAERLRSDLTEMRIEAEKLRSALAEARAEAERASKRADEAVAQAKTARSEATTLAALLERVPGQPDEAPAQRLDRALTQLAEAQQARTVAQDAAQRATQRQAVAETQLANLLGQNNQMRIELVRVKGNGGSGLPYCWASPDGRAQYMLKVSIYDDSVSVGDIEPRARPNDPAWHLIDEVGRSQMMPLETFMRQVAALQGQAASDRCRYSIEVLDGTGRTNKKGYKRIMGRLWTAFNLHEVPR